MSLERSGADCHLAAVGGADRRRDEDDCGKSEPAPRGSRPGSVRKVRRVRLIGIQPVASLREGLHDRVPVVSQRAADIGDALGQAVVGDEGIGPDRLHEHVFRHDLARPRGKHGKHFGGLAAKIDRLAIDGPEFPAFRQEDETAKRDRFGRFRVDFRSLSGHFTLPARYLA